ncbi:MAG: type II/IV secretion system protein [Bacteroidetes bacterium]|nr:type II/IV secretion system protein [Bacteroidota bacterium]
MASIQTLDPRHSAVTHIDHLLTTALHEAASDVHIDPVADGLVIRFRVDGRLEERYSVSSGQKAALVARIKVLANLDIAEKRRPQDGRIRFASASGETDIRVSVVPVIHGEKVVLRILDSGFAGSDFLSLGFSEEQDSLLREALSYSSGLILVTGPTGCGKSTTLYTALQILNEPSRNILTIEDPVERQLAGINQSAVHEAIGYTFPAALRSFLRQDPNVIMVGEIRDAETATIAIRAAMTGHLVLSTLHTQTAAGAVDRLRDIGVEPYLIQATLRLVVSQRLVRTLCPECRQPDPDGKEVLSRQPLGESFSSPESWSVFKPAGCSSCRFTGFRGRRVIGDVFLPGHSAVQQGREDDGLRQSGYRAVAAGRTTLPEILAEVG